MVMVNVQESMDVRERMLANSQFGPSEIELIRRAINEDFSQHGGLREAVTQLEQETDRSPAMSTRLGIGLYLLGRFADSIKILERADGGALAQFYMGLAHRQLDDAEKAAKCYQAAQKAGFDADACQLANAHLLRTAGKAKEALVVLDNLFGPIEQTAEYLYQRAATVSAVGGNIDEAVRLYERAIQVDPMHAASLFGLAVENDRHGNDYEALQLYERAAACFPTGVGALLNLGLAYEDRNQYDRAQGCYRRVLEAYPDHGRARMFMKDAAASGSVYFDEESQRRNDRMSQILNVPVTNFELSVRSRNCLHKMGINTLGDLTRTSEAELLASKNFGETSLYEIREVLAAKGLSLGQFANERPPTDAPAEVAPASEGDQAMLSRPIADLNLSVRARKCMVRLGLTTIGELVRKTGDDLLECKNFGVTSLNEVREKLTEMGLKLRGE
jgi:DNA-directed RNA polymerase subunit alpha